MRCALILFWCAVSQAGSVPGPEAVTLTVVPDDVYKQLVAKDPIGVEVTWDALRTALQQARAAAAGPVSISRTEITGELRELSAFFRARAHVTARGETSSALVLAVQRDGAAIASVTVNGTPAAAQLLDGRAFLPLEPGEHAVQVAFVLPVHGEEDGVVRIRGTSPFRVVSPLRLSIPGPARPEHPPRAVVLEKNAGETVIHATTDPGGAIDLAVSLRPILPAPAQGMRAATESARVTIRPEGMVYNGRITVTGSACETDMVKVALPEGFTVTAVGGSSQWKESEGVLILGADNPARAIFQIQGIADGGEAGEVPSLTVQGAVSQAGTIILAAEGTRPVIGTARGVRWGDRALESCAASGTAAGTSETAFSYAAPGFRVLLERASPKPIVGITMAGRLFVDTVHPRADARVEARVLQGKLYRAAIGCDPRWEIVQCTCDLPASAVIQYPQTAVITVRSPPPDRTPFSITLSLAPRVGTRFTEISLPLITVTPSRETISGEWLIRAAGHVTVEETSGTRRGLRQCAGRAAGASGGDIAAAYRITARDYGTSFSIRERKARFIGAVDMVAVCGRGSTDLYGVVDVTVQSGLLRHVILQTACPHRVDCSFTNPAVHVTASRAGELQVWDCKLPAPITERGRLFFRGELDGVQLPEFQLRDASESTAVTGVAARDDTKISAQVQGVVPVNPRGRPTFESISHPGRLLAAYRYLPDGTVTVQRTRFERREGAAILVENLGLHTTVIGAPQGTGALVTRARVAIINYRSPALQFELAPQARLRSMSLDGKRVRAVRAGVHVRVPVTNGRTNLEITYIEPAPPIGRFGSLELAAPAFTAPVLKTIWDFDVPPGFLLWVERGNMAGQEEKRFAGWRAVADEFRSRPSTQGVAPPDTPSGAAEAAGDTVQRPVDALVDEITTLFDGKPAETDIAPASHPSFPGDDHPAWGNRFTCAGALGRARVELGYATIGTAQLAVGLAGLLGILTGILLYGLARRQYWCPFLFAFSLCSVVAAVVPSRFEVLAGGAIAGVVVGLGCLLMWRFQRALRRRYVAGILLLSLILAETALGAPEGFGVHAYVPAGDGKPIEKNSHPALSLDGDQTVFVPSDHATNQALLPAIVQPAPAYGVGRVEYRGTADGAGVTWEARIPLSVLKAGTVAVPLGLEDATLTTLRGEAIPGTVQRTQEGNVFIVDGPASGTIVAVFSTPVTLADGLWRTSFTALPALAAQVELRAPSESVVAVNGSTRVGTTVRVACGACRRVMVAWRSLAAPRPSWRMAAGRIEVRLLGDKSPFEASFEFTGTGGDIRFVVTGGSVAVLSAESPHVERLIVETDKAADASPAPIKGLTVKLREAATILPRPLRVRFTGIAGIGGSVPILLPAEGPLENMELTIVKPQGLQAHVAAQAGLTRIDESTWNVLDRTAVLAITSRDKRPRIEARVSQCVLLGEETHRLTAELTATVHDVPVTALQVTAAGLTDLDVATEGPLHWQCVHGSAVLRFWPPFTGTTTVRITGTLAGAATRGIPIVQVREATAQRGTILAGSKDLELSGAETAGLSSIAWRPAAWPFGGPLRSHAAFKLVEGAGSYRLLLRPVRPAVPINVDMVHTITVGPGTVSQRARLTFTRRGAAVNSVRWRVHGVRPEGLNLEAGTGILQRIEDGGDLVCEMRWPETPSETETVRCSWQQTFEGHALSIVPITVEGAQRTRTEVRLLRRGDIEVKPVRKEGLLPAHDAGTDPAGEFVPAAVWRTDERSWRLDLAVNPVGHGEGGTAVVERARVTTTATEEGMFLHSACYELLNRREQFLRIAVPFGWRLVEAHLHGKTIRASQTHDGALLIPLPTSENDDRPMRVNVLFESQDDPISLGRMTLVLPWIENISVAETFWDFYAPSSYLVVDARGVRPADATANETVRHCREIKRPRGEDPCDETQIAERTVAVHPAVGTLYRFRKEGDGLRPELLLIPKTLATGAACGLRLLALVIIFFVLAKLRLLVLNPREGWLKPVLGSAVTLGLLAALLFDLALAAGVILALAVLLHHRAATPAAH